MSNGIFFLRNHQQVPDNCNVKVLVLGGTGAMGVHLVSILSNNGAETVVTSRQQRSSENRVRYVQGNARNIEFLATLLCESWDVIVDFMAYSTSDFQKKVSLLLDATSHYIFLSSARVYANSEGPLTEGSLRLLDKSKDKEYLATDEYALSKARQENILKDSGKSNWTVIRPYITYSENRLQLGVLEKEEWLYRALQGRTIVVSTDIDTKATTMTYGFDVALGIAAVIGKPSAMGEVYHITSSETVAWHDVLEIYLNVLENQLGWRPKVLFQNLERFMVCKRGKYQTMYDRLYDRIFDNTKISQHLDTERFIEIKTGLELCLERFLGNPEFNYIDWSYEALRDRQTKEHASLNEINGLREKARYLMYRYIRRSK